MTFAADLHLHSSYAYATSSSLTLENLSQWAKLKGIDLLAAADFTHPTWFRELEGRLTDEGTGLYTFEGMHFALGTEVSCVYRQGGKGRRVHVLLFVPSFDAATRLTRRLTRYGNLKSDGRPTLAISVRDLCHLALEVDPETLVIPAHAWTPWYGLYGSRSGFDSFEEAFADMSPHVPALETGLSSDPAMNWQVSELNDKAIVSFSDAHSLPKLGRELTVFDSEMSYSGLASGLRHNKVAYTVEMYPEEGKYHYDGHRKCGTTLHPRETLREGSICPACGRPLTLGVLHRIIGLSDEAETTVATDIAAEAGGLPEGIVTSRHGRPPFVRLAPLIDIIAAVRKRGTNTKAVMGEYRRLVDHLGSEMQASLWASEADLEPLAGEALARAIISNRRGELMVEPGYDGVYGKVMIP